MSAQYDLYETPDIKQTGEKQPLHPHSFFIMKLVFPPMAP